MSLSIRRSWLRLRRSLSQEVETTWRKLCPRESRDRLDSPARDAVPRVSMLLWDRSRLASDDRPAGTELVECYKVREGFPRISHRKNIF